MEIILQQQNRGPKFHELKKQCNDIYAKKGKKSEHDHSIFAYEMGNTNKNVFNQTQQNKYEF